MTHTSRLTDQICTHTEVRSTFREAIRLFLLDCRFRNLTEETIRGYHVYLQQLQLDLEKWNISLSTIQPRDLSHRMILHMLEAGSAAATINGRIRACQQFFKFLFLEGKMTFNAAEGLKPIKSPRRPFHTFTQEQISLLLKQPDRRLPKGIRDYAIMMILLDTGIRLAELTQLKIADILEEENLIVIRRGKGRKSRSVPIQQTCLNALRHYLSVRQHEYLDDLWLTRKHERFLRHGIMDMLKTYMIQAGVTGIYGSTHIFRHTMAKMFLLNGGDMFTLQTILGHSTLEMTRYYVELFSQDIHKQHALSSPIEHLSQEFHESEAFHP